MAVHCSAHTSSRGAGECIHTLATSRLQIANLQARDCNLQASEAKEGSKRSKSKHFAPDHKWVKHGSDYNGFDETRWDMIPTRCARGWNPEPGGRNLEPGDWNLAMYALISPAPSRLATGSEYQCAVSGSNAGLFDLL